MRRVWVLSEAEMNDDNAVSSDVHKDVCHSDNDDKDEDQDQDDSS